MVRVEPQLKSSTLTFIIMMCHMIVPMEHLTALTSRQVVSGRFPGLMELRPLFEKRC